MRFDCVTQLVRRAVFCGVLWAFAHINASEPVEKEHFIFLFDTPGYVEDANLTLKETRSRLIGLLQDSLSYKPEVHLVDDLDRFQQLIGGVFPDWGAAAAVPHRGRIVIKSPDKFNVNRSLRELLAHEYAHLALAHRTGVRTAPRWFSEGLSMLVSMEWGWEDNLAMSKSAVFGQFITLSEIDQVNRFHEGKARIAYAESYLATAYLFEEYGIEAINIFLDGVARGVSVDNALMASTGSNYADFEAEFRVYLEKRFNIVTLFLDTMWLWIGLAIVVVIGAFLRYRKRRQVYRRWEQEEWYHSTDFDYGDPDDPERVDDDEP